LYLLVKSFCKTFSRFFATRPAAVRFSCVPSGSDPAGVMVYPWGIAAGVAGGGECRKHTRKIKRTFYINPLTFAFTCAILNATSKEVSPMQTFKNAIGYVRVSTEQQAKDDKFGIDVQKQAILLYANTNGYNIVDWKIDEISGAKDDRPALNEILYGDNVTNPPFEAVIVFKNDRLARDTKLYFYYLYTLEKKNIRLLSTKEEFAEGSEFANIYRALLQFVAEQERKNIAIRTSKGRSIKAQCGGYSGGRCPYGYKVENGRLIINDTERPIVEYVFKRFDEHTPMLTIADELNDLGYRTRKGTKFQNTSVRSIVNNRPLYEGMYKYGKEMNWVKGVHEPSLGS
jgi:DNA invertase Pin-like site-specific DNA recombinase